TRACPSFRAQEFRKTGVSRSSRPGPGRTRLPCRRDGRPTSILTQERTIKYARIHHATAGGNLLRGWRCRRTGGSPFQPRPVSVGAQRETRGKGPGILEIAGPLPAALLGWVVGYPLRALYSNRRESPLPLRCFILPRS